MSHSNVYHYEALPSGVRALTLPLRDRDSVALAIWLSVGSRYEIQSEAGTSHFLEHALFKGTKKRSGRQIRETVEGVGGVLNAFTGEESTCFFSKVLTKHFNQTFDVLGDMIANATLKEPEMKKEKSVILEEIKMYKDLSAHHVHDLMGELLWPSHPLGRPISGTFESVSRLTRADLIRFKKNHYHRKNILVAAAGPIEHARLVRKAREFFEDLPAYVNQAPQEATAASHSGPQSVFLYKDSEQTHFVLGFHAFSRFDPRRYSLSLLNVILGANMSSRLFEEIREKRGLAYEIRSGVSAYEDTGSFLISAGVENKKTKLAIQVILNELRKIAAHQVKAQELRRAKDYFLGQFSMGLEDSLEHLLWAGERTLEFGDAPDRAEIFKSLEAVNEKEIQKVAQVLFSTHNLNLALIGPMRSPAQNKIKKIMKLS